MIRMSNFPLEIPYLSMTLRNTSSTTLNLTAIYSGFQFHCYFTIQHI